MIGPPDPAFLRRVSIWSEAQDIVERLAAATGETAMVGVLDDGQVLYIAIGHPQRSYGIESLPGTRHPAHCTALGKAILAWMPEAEVLTLLGARPPIRLTAKTLTDQDVLMNDLRATRARGYAIDDEERVAGVYCLGAPIQDHAGSVRAAVSVSGPAFRMRERDEGELSATLIAVARSSSLSLGYPDNEHSRDVTDVER